MAKDNEHEGSPTAAQGARPATEPATLDAAFLEILDQLESKGIEPARARARILALYQMGLGAWVRALKEAHPEITGGLIERLIADLRSVSPDAQSQVAGLGPRSAAARQSQPIAVSGKDDAVLKREIAVLEALIRSDRLMKFHDLYSWVTDTEPGLKGPTLTANLNRLADDGVIARPRKGYYGASPRTRDYLAALKDELLARE